MLWLCQCPTWLCQGLVRPRVTNNGIVVLLCDEGDEVWLHPDDVGTIEPLFPRSPDLDVGPAGVGSVWMRKGARRAELADVADLGWDVEWNDDDIDLPAVTLDGSAPEIERAADSVDSLPDAGCKDGSADTV